jgi:hypothetical protein
MEIQKYNGAVNSLPEMLKMAEYFAASGMFTDAREKGQAFVKIQAGAELGILPFQAMAGIHIIKGKPAIGSGLIAAKVKASGKYNYKVLEQTDKVCRIEFFEKVAGKFESIGISEMTIEQARKQGSQNLDRLPLNMLFARAISNGVRWHCPDVFMGSVYTPDEMGAKVNENEEPIDTDYTEVRSTPAIQAPEPAQKVEVPLTPEQVAEKVNMLVTAFEAKGIDKLQIKATTGKDITEINEADIAILREMYKELVANPAPDKFELMAKYKTIFQDAN